MTEPCETPDRPSYAPAPRLMGYARVSTRGQSDDRQIQDLIAAGVRRHDVHTDYGVSGSEGERPGLTRVLDALYPGDTLVVTTLDRLGRSVTNMLELATRLRARGVNLRVLNLGGGSVDTTTPIGSMVFTIMAALAQMELDIKRERIQDSVAKRRAVGGDLGGRRQQYSDRIIKLAAQVAGNNSSMNVTQTCREMGISRATYYRRLKAMNAGAATPEGDAG